MKFIYGRHFNLHIIDAGFLFFFFFSKASFPVFLPTFKDDKDDDDYMSHLRTHTQNFHFDSFVL